MKKRLKKKPQKHSKRTILRFFTNVFGYLSDSSPSGIPLSPNHHLKPHSALREEFPFYAKKEIPWLSLLTTVGACFLVTGFFTALKALFVFGATLLLWLHLGRYAAWEASDVIKVSSSGQAYKAHENEEINLELRLKNMSSDPVYHLLLRVELFHKMRRHYFEYVEHLPGHDRRMINIKIPLDFGMGEFEVSKVLLSSTDRMGIHVFSLEVPLDAKITVFPEQGEVSKVTVDRAGASLHTGEIEVRLTGTSPNFLGLRDFRVGDSIKNIDWKRSANREELITREFEHFSSTDVTVFIDNVAAGHSAFENESSFETMRDAVLAVVRTLSRQNFRVSLISEDIEVMKGTGNNHLDYLTDVVTKMPLVESGNICSTIKDHSYLVESDSLVVVFICSKSLGEDARGAFFDFYRKRVEVILVVIDSLSFASTAIEKTQILKHAHIFVGHIESVLGNLKEGADLHSFSRRLSDRTYVLSRGKELVDVYDYSLGI